MYDKRTEQSTSQLSFVLTAQRGTITGMRTTVSWSTTLVHTKIIQQRHQWIESFFVVPFEYPNILVLGVPFKRSIIFVYVICLWHFHDVSRYFEHRMIIWAGYSMVTIREVK